MLTGSSREVKYIDPSSATNYSNNNDVQFNQAKDFIDAHGNLIKGHVLDLGSGDGKVTAYIAKTIGEPITGLDISEARVKFANENYGNTRLKFIVCNITNMIDDAAFSSQQFGTVMSFNTLHHIPKSMQLSVFLQTKKLLQDDGVALFLIPGRSPELHDAINETATHSTWKSYFADFDLTTVRTYETPEYYKHLCKRAGFYCSVATSFDEAGGKELDAEAFKKFLSGWLPHLAYLKSKNANDVIQDEFLTNITSLYFTKLKKEINQTVNPKITQNKIIGYSSSSSFFQKKPQNPDRQPTQVSKIRARL